MFTGALNSNPRDPAAASIDYLTPAIEAVLAGRKPDPGFMHPLGLGLEMEVNIKAGLKHRKRS